MKRKYAFAARFLVTASLTSDRLLAHNEQGGLLTGPRFRLASAR
ncbi:hypothetical protein ACNY67_00480 [Pantoea sp. KXB45]|nr:hypothetical protein [uncultured Pantoea sp.]